MNLEGENYVSSSSVPSENLLKGVVAFVEVFHKGTDRSVTIKLRIQAMGGTISEKLCSKVTHVIFEDGSFSTYINAKLLKAHVVSMLWLEDVRNNSCHMDEKNYPPLGIDSYDANATQICKDNNWIACCNFKDYEEVVNEECSRRLTLQPRGASSSNTGKSTEHSSMSSEDGHSSRNNSVGNKRNPQSSDIRKSLGIPIAEGAKGSFTLPTASTSSSKTGKRTNNSSMSSEDGHSSRNNSVGNKRKPQSPDIRESLRIPIAEAAKGSSSLPTESTSSKTGKRTKHLSMTSEDGCSSSSISLGNKITGSDPSPSTALRRSERLARRKTTQADN